VVAADRQRDGMGQDVRIYPSRAAFVGGILVDGWMLYSCSFHSCMIAMLYTFTRVADWVSVL